jgi:sugar lactone lactonase YvrE
MSERIERQLRWRNYIIIGVMILGAVMICALSAGLILRSFQPSRKIPFVVQPGASVQTLVELAGERAHPEAITLGPDGFLYSGSFCTGEIWRISPEGDLEIYLAEDSGVSAASGMAFAPDGTLYVVDREDCDPRRSTSSVKRISPDGMVDAWGRVSTDQILNGLAFDANGHLYATDSQDGVVLVFDDAGNPSEWWRIPEPFDDSLPTGITYDTARDALIIADSNNGAIFRVPIVDGSAGESQVLLDDPSRALDGLTQDEQGRIIATVINTSEVIRIDENGSVTILAQNFREPSDAAYLDGRLYVTNFDSVSLAPFVSILIDPSLPFTIDVIDLAAE